MEKLVGEQGSHGGTADVDGGVPVAAVDEKVTQQGTKHHDKHGIAGATPSKSKDAPWSAGHGDAHSTAVLPAARKKGAHSGFPMESSFKGWSAGCARSKWSYDRLCYDWYALWRRHKLNGATAASSGKIGEKNGEKMATVKTL